ncbi:MAG: hypothetical protein QNJ69_06815 [Gammaproteobacteria bacterium]|nr:hypothetical protein [Gammaproteobacteria bacterium]
MNDQLTLEYIFFHSKPYQLFKNFLQSRQVKLLQEGVDQTNVEGYLVAIADDLDDKLSEEIEAYYDEMMALTEQLVTQESNEDEMNIVGLAVSLQDGRSVLASVDPEVLNRILTVVSSKELGQLVDAIVDAVENPDQQPLCKRD